jgi:hypothetical protein
MSRASGNVPLIAAMNALQEELLHAARTDVKRLLRQG